MTDRLYWYGNAAKTEVIQEILARSRSMPTVVFDYGCGDAGDWPLILDQHRHIELLAYEPDRGAAARARDRLRGLSARVYSGPDIESLTETADYIVSFSVFEHVYDRPAYLRHARRILSPEGVFFLNYDDGHFRNIVDLAHLRSVASEFRPWLRNVAQPVLTPIGFRRSYQRRVTRTEADALIESCGFQILQSSYRNLRSMKLLAPTIQEARRQEFARVWLDMEKMLNEEFQEEGPETLGDSVNLWREMLSRTVWLKHRS